MPKRHERVCLAAAETGAEADQMACLLLFGKRLEDSRANRLQVGRGFGVAKERFCMAINPGRRALDKLSEVSGEDC
jgi:hypothetical protein